jgi:hypothetical protein
LGFCVDHAEQSPGPRDCGRGTEMHGGGQLQATQNAGPAGRLARQLFVRWQEPEPERATPACGARRDPAGRSAGVPFREKKWVPGTACHGVTEQ